MSLGNAFSSFPSTRRLFNSSLKAPSQVIPSSEIEHRVEVQGCASFSIKFSLAHNHAPHPQFRSISSTQTYKPRVYTNTLQITDKRHYILLALYIIFAIFLCAHSGAIQHCTSLYWDIYLSSKRPT